MTQREEVEFGVGQEIDVLIEWMGLSPLVTGWKQVLSNAEVSSGFADFDFAVFDGSGLPLVYVEIKVRRVIWGEYPDVIYPERKHHFGLKCKAMAIPFIGVTRYIDGRIVECDLAEEPDSRRMIYRRDRDRGVMHSVYNKDRLTVYGKAATSRVVCMVGE